MIILSHLLKQNYIYCCFYNSLQCFEKTFTLASSISRTSWHNDLLDTQDSKIRVIDIIKQTFTN